jgi:taurine dioxygenase
METEPLTGHIGAELRGVDLRDLDDDAFGAVHRAFLEHQVVLLPGQFLNPAELLAFARRFGEIFPNPLSPKAAGQPEVTELVTRDGGAPDRFHFDTSYVDVPPKISVLSMVRSPPVGGDTLWNSSTSTTTPAAPRIRTPPTIRSSPCTPRPVAPRSCSTRCGADGSWSSSGPRAKPCSRF